MVDVNTTTGCIVDIHEKKIHPLFLKFNVKHTIKALKVGDIVYGDIVFERKEIVDFWGSICSNRVFEQAMNMKSNYNHCFILISGHLMAGYKDVPQYNHKVVLGAMARLTQSPYYCNIVCLDNDSMLVQFIDAVCKKKDNPQVFAKRLGISSSDISLAQLTCIPGIGVSTAKLILKEHTQKDLYTLDVKELVKIKGISERIANIIKDTYK